MQPGHNGFNFALRVIPRHTHFPAHTQIESEVRTYLVRVFAVGAAISRAGIQELLAALIVVGRRANEKVDEVGAGLAAVETEVSIGCAGVALIDLQIAEFTAKF